MRVKGEMMSLLAMLLSCRQKRSTSWLMRWSLQTTTQSNWTSSRAEGGESGEVTSYSDLAFRRC